MHFVVIFRYLKISFAEKSFNPDQVLTKILQIDQKFTFNVFHILNQGRISKIEKLSDGTDPPKKKVFFWGGAGALKAKDFGYVSDRKDPKVVQGETICFFTQSKNDQFHSSDHFFCVVKNMKSHRNAYWY